MSLFQCESCGCCENTACAYQGFKPIADAFSWEGLESKQGKLLCSACGPTKYADGTPTEFGVWHGIFTRRFLPKGQFKTAKNGNLEHVETGSQDITPFVLAAPEKA